MIECLFFKLCCFGFKSRCSGFFKINYPTICSPLCMFHALMIPFFACHKETSGKGVHCIEKILLHIKIKLNFFPQMHILLHRHSHIDCLENQFMQSTVKLDIVSGEFLTNYICRYRGWFVPLKTSAWTGS